MSSALFGILQLDKGEPYGFAEVGGLIQSWLQDAGGFAMIGLVVYLLYALATPTDKSQSEKLRVPTSSFMVACAALALVCYAGVGGLYALQASNRTALAGITLAEPVPPPPPPGMPIVPPRPAFHTELIPLLTMFAGLFALLGIGEPFARDMAKIARRNLSLSFTGVRRFGRSVATYTREAFSTRRLTVAGILLGAYAALGVLIYVAFPGSRLFGIYAGVCVVGVTVFLLAMLTLMLFQAEGPIWAVAKLSFKEAVRSQLLWVFLIIFLPSLFPTQWFRSMKASDELRTSVGDLSTVLAFLILFPALLLSSFSIPNDIKNLNIYTVVSKPVERFEIVLGRFVGYVSLMTLVLIGLTGVSLVLLTNTQISERAREETYKARVPVRGKIDFKSVLAQFRTEKVDFSGTNVGREFDYRKYISGHPDSPQRAIWHFPTVPSGLARAEGDRVPVEFTFDIFKMTKGEQNKGVQVSFRFVTHNARQDQPDKAVAWPWKDKQRQEQYEAAKKKYEDGGVNLQKPRPGTDPATRASWEAANKLAEEFGVFEYAGKEVFDYQVMGIDVPAGLFRNALQGTPATEKDPNTGVVTTIPRVSVYVKCESPGQLLGMAEPDLYLLEYEQPFWSNYLKGMVGLWCWLCVLVGLAVALSTYLSGVLTLLVAGAIFAVGFFPDFIRDLGANRNVGGGPFQALSQVLKAEQPTAPLADNSATKAVTIADRGAAWAFRRVQNVIPDLDAFDWSQFVAEGFNINSEYLVVSVLMMFGYLLPWGILSYYLMKSREVAA